MENKFFKEIKNNFGLGCMRLPLNAEETIDIEQTKQMVDLFLEKGFNYFDTAHGYHKEESEVAVKKALTSRYPREKYILTNKLTGSYFNSQEEIRPLFEKQLEACGVEYFDFYLMHAQNKAVFEKFKSCKAYETSLELKAEGKFKHFGISFHDKAAVLDEILCEYPQIEVVQLQFNYLDYDDVAVESRKCYEVCVKHKKPVIVMEPIRGGNLIKLPDDAEEVVQKYGISKAELAIRFAAGFENIMMVLSGMHCLQDLEENISFMADFKPLSEEEMQLTKTLADIIHSKRLISCTGCRYCVAGCPMNIAIPNLLNGMNFNSMFKNWQAEPYYKMHTNGKGKASDCIECGQCEDICPQQLPIRSLLKDVAKTFEG